MNRRRRIYRGFKRRNDTKIIRVITVGLCLCLIGGYTYVKVKDSKIFSNNIFSKNIVSSLVSKIPLLDKFKPKEPTVITNKDIPDELEKIAKEKEKSKEAKENEVEETEDIKVAIIEGWNIYTIQAASIKDESEIEKIESKLSEKKIPFSIVEIDGLKKVQTYSFFDKETTRSYLEEVRKVIPDAFLSEMKVPILSLEYTSKYAYVDEISKQLNKLIANFEEESKFWTNNKNNIDIKEYNQILTSRGKIVDEIEKEANKIDYPGASSFKENVIKYVKDMSDKIQQSSKAANEEKYYISESLYLSSMQGYFLFINSIKEA